MILNPINFLIYDFRFRDSAASAAVNNAPKWK